MVVAHVASRILPLVHVHHLHGSGRVEVRAYSVKRFLLEIMFILGRVLLWALTGLLLACHGDVGPLLLRQNPGRLVVAALLSRAQVDLQVVVV